MNIPGQSGKRSAERLIEIVAAGLLNVALGVQHISAAEYVAVPEVEFMEATSSFTDWISRSGTWKYRSGPIRYGTGATNHTRYHEYRLPVCPPLYDPSFGFRFTCWRQLSYERRCYLSDTLWHRPKVDYRPPAAAGRIQMENEIAPPPPMRENPQPLKQAPQPGENQDAPPPEEDLSPAIPDDDDAPLAIPSFRIEGDESKGR